MLKKFVSSKPVVIVSGCTGTGKSDLAIAIAKKFDGEVISADSMQIYRGLDIVTNKVTEQEMDGIRHHLMSFYDPTMAEFNVQSFRESALQIMEDLWAENKLPIIAGGTQYYTESIMYKGNLVDAKHDSKMRQDLEKMSNEELYEKLKQVDPESAEMVHINNRARVLRAVEIFLLTGTKKSQIIEMQKNSDLDGGLRFPNTLLIHVDANEQVLNQRLKSRIGKMTDRGLKQELTSFYDEVSNFLFFIHKKHF
uniref:Isopentenyltransferase n=1 Tax=Panagrolaimus sp. JU765 TaxID=591449 RepID=A0AC34R1B0_9BILA